MLSCLPALLTIAGLLHFGLLLASFSVPRVLEWGNELKKVSPLTRQLVLVHGGFIVLVIIGFGAVTLLAGRELLTGSRLATVLTAFIGVFWSCRLAIQVCYFDARPWLTTPFRQIGYRALYLVFTYLAAVYWISAYVNVTRW